jgi:hypothetical protein
MSSEQPDSLVFDASVTINFLGTGIAGKCIGLLDRHVIMADRTFAEIHRHPIKGRDHVAELDALVRNGQLQIETLSGTAKDLFFELIGDDLTGGLDDGEAAAIALAVSRGQSTLIGVDDRKARAVLTARWPNQPQLYSLDLLTSELMVSGLPGDALADCVHSALQNARMRVPFSQRAAIVALIGVDRAKACPSLGSAF